MALRRTAFAMGPIGGAQRLRSKEYLQRRGARQTAVLEARQQVAEDLRALPTACVVDGLADSVRVSATQSVSGEALWNSSCVLRESSHARDRFGSCVVGDAAAICKIWHEYGVRPSCVYVPDDEDVPSWCFEKQGGTSTDVPPLQPTVIVRTDVAAIKTQLLSAELSDGYAAEFPIPVAPSLLDLTQPAASAADGQVNSVQLRRTLVLHKTRNASNVGVMARSAVESGFDSIIFDRCVDPFNEKVLRESRGVPFDPRARFFSLSDRARHVEEDEDAGGNQRRRAEESNVDLLQRAAIAHRLLPIMAVPDSSAEPIFQVAQRFHNAQAAAKAAQATPLGAMVIVGSEVSGLADLQDEWTIPAKLTTISMDNALVNSMNVAHATSIVLHHFRPEAARNFAELRARGVVPADWADEETEQMLRLTESRV